MWRLTIIGVELHFMDPTRHSVSKYKPVQLCIWLHRNIMTLAAPRVSAIYDLFTPQPTVVLCLVQHNMSQERLLLFCS
jgi:hypothetical protein